MIIFRNTFIIAAVMFTFFITCDEGSFISRAGAQEVIHQPPVCHRTVRQSDGTWVCEGMREGLFRNPHAAPAQGCRTMADINRPECDGLGILAAISVANAVTNGQQADLDAEAAEKCRKGWSPRCETVGVLPTAEIAYYGANPKSASPAGDSTASARTAAEMLLTECIRQNRAGCELK